MESRPRRAPRANKFIRNRPQTRSFRKRLTPDQIAVVIRDKILNNQPVRPAEGPEGDKILAALDRLQGVERPHPLRAPRKRRTTRRNYTPVSYARRPATKVNTVAVSCVSRPFAGVSVLDITGFTSFCEHVIAHYATGDLLTTIEPLALMQYFIYTLFLFLESCGSLEGISVSSGAAKIKLSIPYAVAKYFEYCAPYTNEVMASLKYVYNAADFPESDDGSVGNMVINAYPRPAFGAPWRIFTMSNANAIQAATSTNYLPQNSIMLVTDGYQVSFANFLITPNLIANISTALNRKGNTIPLSKIPRRAPDSSAYSRCRNVPGLTFAQGGTLSVDGNYDPELTAMFAPTLIESEGYSLATQKSTINPTFNYTGVEIAPFCQVASVCVFLAQTYKGRYRPGTFKKAFPFLGSELKTYYPREQPISGNALSQVVQAAHNQLIANKTGDNNTDPINQKLVLEAIIAFSCFQARMNITEVCHYNVPAIKIDEPVYLIPQFNYADAQWYSTNLPPEVAAAISTIGPVVSDGQMVIPVNNFAFKQTDTTGGSAVGPQNWSAFGFTNAFDDYFLKSLLWSTTWGLASTPLDTPNLVVDSTTFPPTTCNTTYYDDFYGVQVIDSQLAIYTMLFNGGTGATLLNQYNSWLISNQSTQQTPTAQVHSCLEGDFTVMTMAYTKKFTDQQATSCQPIGVPGIATINPNQGGNLTMVSGGPDSTSYTQPTTVKNAFSSAVFAQGYTGDTSVQTPQEWARFISWKQRVILRIPAPIDATQVPLSGPHTFDFPWSTGYSSLVQGVSNTISNPTQSLWNKPIPQAAQKGLLNPTVVDKFKELTSSLAHLSLSSTTASSVPAKKYTTMSKKARFGKFLTNTMTASLKGGEFVAKEAVHAGEKVANKAEKMGTKAGESVAG